MYCHDDNIDVCLEELIMFRASLFSRCVQGTISLVVDYKSSSIYRSNQFLSTVMVIGYLGILCFYIYLNNYYYIVIKPGIISSRDK